MRRHSSGLPPVNDRRVDSQRPAAAVFLGDPTDDYRGDREETA
jgi:hypothetical protein